MKKQIASSYRLETSSLSSLKMALTYARRALPPRDAKKDASDELVLRLIQRVQAEYKYKKQPSMARRAVKPARAGVKYRNGES